MKRVQFKKVAICAFLALAFVSCSQDINSPNPKPDSRGPQLQLNYSFNDGYSAVVDQQPITRAVEATIPEKTVNDVAIIFYNERDGRYVACDTYNNSVNHGSSGSFTFATPAGVIAGQKYRLLIVGNYNSYKPAGQSIKDYMSANQGLSIEEMKKQLYVELSDDHRVVSPLPFVGQLIDGNGTPTVLTAPDRSTRSLNVSVRFSRIVSRFDLKNLAADQLNIQWAKVCQYRKGGYSHLINVPKGDIIRGTSRTAPNLGALPEGYVAASPKSGTTQSLLGGLYAFPNVVNISTQNDKETTFILIAGYYTAPGSPENTSKITYYRMNVSKNGKPQVLEQNNVYTLVINKVRGEGMETEEGAAQSSDLMLDYVADDFWENDATNNTNVDERGNYLTLSNTTVVLDSKKDEVAIVKVGVKDGLTWDAYWATNPTHSGQSKPVFTYEKIDATSFRITTNEENNSKYTNSGTLVVQASGSSIPKGSVVRVVVNIIQLTSNPDKKLLMVDGKLDSFDYSVPGEGAKIIFPVITGSQDSRWLVEYDKSVSSWSVENNSGSNNGSLIINCKANTTNLEQVGTFKVYRLLQNQEKDSIKPITITFHQKKSPYIVTYDIEDYLGLDNLVIDGFDPQKGVDNAYSVRLRCLVHCLNRSKYNIKVYSNFNKNVDLCISKEAFKKTTDGPGKILISSTARLTDKPDNLNELTFTNMENEFYIYLFRTGPGDAPIKGEVYVQATPISNTGDLEVGTYSKSITIESSCIVGEPTVQVGTYYFTNIIIKVMDRNVGTPIDGVPLYYSALEKQGDEYINNSIWRGEYLYASDHVCSDYAKKMNKNDFAKWVPIKYEDITINPFISSKGRIYIASYDKEKGKYVGTYFPYDNFENKNFSRYVAGNDSRSQLLTITNSGAVSFGGGYGSYLGLIRCAHYLNN